jgi:hypothetical protein
MCITSAETEGKRSQDLSRFLQVLAFFQLPHYFNLVTGQTAASLVCYDIYVEILLQLILLQYPKPTYCVQHITYDGC